MSGYFPGPWPGEDAGIERTQRGSGRLPTPITVTSRTAPVTQMAITRGDGELYLLLVTPEQPPVPYLEQIDPVTLEPIRTSEQLPTGPMWPGSIAAHRNGSIYAVVNNHAVRLEADLSVTTIRKLPRARPYNGFIILDDGHLVTKDFAGSRPDQPVAAEEREPCELLVLEPEGLEIVARCLLPEPSIARISASGNDVYVVGDTSLLRAHWDGSSLTFDAEFVAPYRSLPGQTYGWDCTIGLGAAWLLDNGDGSEAYTGTMRGHGISSAPLHLIRVDLATAEVTLTEVCGLPDGLIANPPLVDAERRIVVSYDSANGVMTAFDIAEDGGLTQRWSRSQDHAAHMILFPESGQLLSGHHDAEAMVEYVVILDIASGEELSRAPSGSMFQSPIFPAVGFDNDAYLCSFLTICRIH